MGQESHWLRPDTTCWDIIYLFLGFSTNKLSNFSGTLTFAKSSRCCRVNPSQQSGTHPSGDGPVCGRRRPEQVDCNQKLLESQWHRVLAQQGFESGVPGHRVSLQNMGKNCETVSCRIFMRWKIYIYLNFQAHERRLNKTPTWCNKMQILLLQTFSTCFGRHAPIIRSVK